MGKLPFILTAGEKRHKLRRLVALGLCLVLIGGLVAILLITSHGSNLKRVTPVLRVSSKSETASKEAVGETLSGGKDKLVALTFDDGPGPYTMRVAQVLVSKGAPATFFLIGRQISTRESIVNQLRADGFELEDHTWDHVNLKALSLPNLQFEMESTAKAIGGVKYVRPPSGAFNPLVIATAHALGLKIALWNVDTLDWKDRNAAHILARVEAGVRPGAIILMHDAGGDRSQTVAVLPQVIDWLRAHGYTLVTVDELGAAAIRGTIK
jgi:peptidoglycan/xylan/chitin deacetylase (PgdA/CDA1 family)